MTRNGVAVTAIAVALLLGVGVATPAQAEKCSGKVAYVPKSSESLELPDGRTILRNHDSGIIFADDPSSVFNGVQQDCSATIVINADGETGQAHGYCDGIDKDGDVFWISWGGPFTGGTWQTVGGTGKFEGANNSGTYVDGGAFANGNYISLWEGECSVN